MYIVLEEADLQDTGDKWSVGLIYVTPLLMIEGCETVWYSVYNHPDSGRTDLADICVFRVVVLCLRWDRDLRGTPWSGGNGQVGA